MITITESWVMIKHFQAWLRREKLQSWLINSLIAQGHIINDITKTALWRLKAAYTGLLVYQGQLFFLTFLLIFLSIVLGFTGLQTPTSEWQQREQIETGRVHVRKPHT